MRHPIENRTRERLPRSPRIGPPLSPAPSPSPHDPHASPADSSVGGSSAAGGVALSTGSSLAGSAALNGSSQAGSAALNALHDPGATSLGGSAGVPGTSVAKPARATFEAGELAVVCSHYDIGVIESVREYRRGSGRAPKAVIRTDRGRYLLKRRPLGSSGADRVAYTHALQQHLAARRYPLPRLVLTRTDRASWLEREGHIYELFDFVPGEPYDGSLDSTADAGRALGFFHRLVGNFVHRRYQPKWGTYHAAGSGLEPHFDQIIQKIPTPEVAQLVASLRAAYADAAAHAEEAGFATWPSQTIHGDWHPGNMLFRNTRVVAVIDYDTARLAPRVIDIANGALQFSISMQPGLDPAAWPVPLDEGRFKRFCRGYETVPGQVISTGELAAMPWLMIEALIVEACVPIAAAGSFGGISGDAFLRMVHAKTDWIASHAHRLTALVGE